ncbi:similar to Saccharomyces cerevisiae YDL072C YET3 Protein of unknown function [Maudiozyma barnettii]|uniref:Endoplasmic reticulum transmembrane protein n=1 Tax=Maudiozyma barnettii TaxID=61262 RepID=A0A8H2ZJX7_9SACH|nr:Yet3p [Kazachstania barnettii]CAB4256982.1 similar to Saccharomyces cerevisiae YDL072C YET3 Protein of unknown function [Kazachstania barnettii]CAD1779353.1 similar to Saccharomyces cerevisiae YDL072C YET3 Protein of unknown function [Kazachstania barnettii]
MSLYYSLIFGILVLEIVLFTLLALPIPTKFRKPLTLVLLKPFKNSNVQVAIKCILGFILLLFIDSINKVYNINKELAIEVTQGHQRIELLSRKFFQQRNLYLTGITLFLTFIVTKTFALVNELLNLKAKYRKDDHKDEEELTKEELEILIKEKEDKIKDLKERAEALEKNSKDL